MYHVAVLVALTSVNAATSEGSVVSVHVQIVQGTIERNVILRLQTQDGTAIGKISFAGNTGS